MAGEAPGEEPLPLSPVRGLRWDLKQVAIVAFLAGVFLHACVLAALLDSGDAGPKRSAGPIEVRPGTSPTQVVASVTPLADRRNCAEIRGTDYRSESERQWFIANCL